jgi:hypothetical protein
MNHDLKSTTPSAPDMTSHRNSLPPPSSTSDLTTEDDDKRKEDLKRNLVHIIDLFNRMQNSAKKTVNTPIGLAEQLPTVPIVHQKFQIGEHVKAPWFEKNVWSKELHEGIISQPTPNTEFKYSVYFGDGYGQWIPTEKIQSASNPPKYCYGLVPFDNDHLAWNQLLGAIRTAIEIYRYMMEHVQIGNRMWIGTLNDLRFFRTGTVTSIMHLITTSDAPKEEKSTSILFKLYKNTVQRIIVDRNHLIERHTSIAVNDLDLKKFRISALPYISDIFGELEATNEATAMAALTMAINEIPGMEKISG